MAVRRAGRWYEHLARRRSAPERAEWCRLVGSLVESPDQEDRILGSQQVPNGFYFVQGYYQAALQAYAIQADVAASSELVVRKMGRVLVSAKDCAVGSQSQTVVAKAY